MFVCQGHAQQIIKMKIRKMENMQFLFFGGDKGFSLRFWKYSCYVISYQSQEGRSSSDMAHGGVWADSELWKIEGSFRFILLSAWRSEAVCVH